MFPMLKRARKRDPIEEDLIEISRKRPEYDNYEELAEILEKNYSPKDLQISVTRLKRDRIVTEVKGDKKKHKLVYHPIM